MNNISNNLIDLKVVADLIKKYTGIQKVKISSLNYNYYIQAFVHKSFLLSSKDNEVEDSVCHLNLPRYILENNERLEYFGDSVIYAVISQYLYDTFPDKKEGFLSVLRTKLVCKQSLSYLARKLNFQNYLLISCHLELAKAREQNDALLENVFESFIGALYKDQGFEVCKKFILSVITEFIDMKSLIEQDNNYKSQLLAKFHSMKWTEPVYYTLWSKGMFNTKEHATCIKLDKCKVTQEKYKRLLSKLDISKKMNLNEEYYHLCIGKATTVKAAQQESSKLLLSKLQ